MIGIMAVNRRTGTRRHLTLAAGTEMAPARDARPPGATPGRLRALEDLRWHWDEAYEIGWDGRFRAERLDGRGYLEAPAAQELRDLIFAGYTACPVPRRYRKDPEDEDAER
jgi:hypothetical protein